jgi:hypothetical protein
VRPVEGRQSKVEGQQGRDPFQANRPLSFHCRPSVGPPWHSTFDVRPSTLDAGYSRIIGEPRLYKGFAKIFNCDAGGVAELMLQKRDAPGLLKSFKHGVGPELHRWTHENGRITSVES